MVKTFRDLIVWQKSVQLVTSLYLATKAFPKEEIYGLVSQMRRCAVSIPSNIAEGYGRRTKADYLRFLQVSVGSVFELQTQLEISRNLTYLSPKDYDALHSATREIERMLISPGRLHHNLFSEEDLCKVLIVPAGGETLVLDADLDRVIVFQEAQGRAA